MKAAGVSTDSQGSTSSVEGGSASLHDEIVRPYGCVWDCCRSKQLMWS
jgi:hypothetical protein